MKEENKEKTQEKSSEIIILDRGNGIGDDPGPDFACCFGAYFPLRW